MIFSVFVSMPLVIFLALFGDCRSICHRSRVYFMASYKGRYKSHLKNMSFHEKEKINRAMIMQQLLHSYNPSNLRIEFW